MSLAKRIARELYLFGGFVGLLAVPIVANVIGYMYADANLIGIKALLVKLVSVWATLLWLFGLYSLVTHRVTLGRIMLNIALWMMISVSTLILDDTIFVRYTQDITSLLQPTLTLLTALMAIIVTVEDIT